MLRFLPTSTYISFSCTAKSSKAGVVTSVVPSDDIEESIVIVISGASELSASVA